MKNPAAFNLGAQPAFMGDPELTMTRKNFGLTKREHFAGLAMEGLVASEDENNGFGDLYEGPDGKQTYAKDRCGETMTAPRIPNKLIRTADEGLVSRAVKLADLLLIELAKSQFPEEPQEGRS